MTFEGEPVPGELTTDFPVSHDGIPVLLVNDEPFSPEEAEFFMEYATGKELEMLREGGYDLPAGEGGDEGYEKGEEMESDDD